MWSKKAAAHLISGILSLLLALVTGSLGLAVLGLFFLTSVVVAYLVQRRVAIDIDRQASADRVREDDHVQVVTGLRGRGIGTGFIEVRDSLDARLDVKNGSNYRIVNLPRGREDKLTYELHTPIRGVYGLGPTEVRKTDLYELFFNIHEVPQSIAGVTVLPRSEMIKEARVKSLTPKILTGIYSVRSPGIGSDFYALRQYTSADPMRDVNWKASARAGHLIVNQWQHETVASGPIIVDGRAIQGSGTLAGNPLLYSCRGAATMVEELVGERSTIRFVSYGSQVHTIQPDSGERQFYKVLARLSSLEPSGNLPMVEVVHELLPTLSKRSPVIVFSSLEDDPTVFEALSILLAHDMKIMVFVPSGPEFLKAAEDNPLRDREYRLRRLKHQIEVKRVRGLGVRVILWQPEERLELAFLRGLATE